MKYIYHITTQEAWEEAQAAGVYTAPSLETEGFIHCSTLQQVIPVANAFYKDVPDLLLLEIEVDRLESEVKWEAPAHPDPDNPPETEEQDLFPHVYGVIDVGAVKMTSTLSKDEENNHRLSFGLEMISSIEGDVTLESVREYFSTLFFNIYSPMMPLKGYVHLLTMDVVAVEDVPRYAGIIHQKLVDVEEHIEAGRRMVHHIYEQEKQDDS